MVAALFAVIAVTGMLHELRSPSSLALTASIAALAPLAYWASRRELPKIWLHVFVGLVLLLLTAAIWNCGYARDDFVDLYVFPVMFAFYFFTTRQAIGYLTIGAVLFSVTLYSSDYPFELARMLMSLLVVSILGAMLAKARAATLAFASHAVELSVVDPLTGAANLRGLRQRVADEIARSELTGKKVAVLGIDIDDFKAVNDTYSHARGDSVLRATVEATRSCLRADELVARRGGDEFAAVCAVNRIADAEAIANRIRATIIEARSELCPDLLATASVAVTIREPDERLEDFLARVDDCLHDEKQLTRLDREQVLARA